MRQSIDIYREFIKAGRLISEKVSLNPLTPNVRQLNLLRAVKEVEMDFVRKAQIRLEHWIDHSEHHLEDYESFSRELESQGKAESARYIREMTELSKKSTECLRKALAALT